MLKVTIPENELFIESDNTFVSVKKTILTLEHSLVSISKWESIFHKPFIEKTGIEKKTAEEIIEYIKCMTITQNVDPNVYLVIPPNVFKEINDYISSPLSATTFSKQEGKAPSREIITSELIYYWMIACQIPIECEKWPIQRLLNLIKICSIKNSPQKKMSQRDLINSNTALNAARKRQAHTKG